MPTLRAAFSLPVAASQNLTVPSAIPAASVVPSGLYARQNTSPACPPTVARSLPVATSQILIVRPRVPAARVLLSGLKATQFTSPAFPLSVSGSLCNRRRLVLDGDRGFLAVVLAEREVRIEGQPPRVQVNAGFALIDPVGEADNTFGQGPGAAARHGSCRPKALATRSCSSRCRPRRSRAPSS